jgi:hypothetical protein
MFIVVGISGKAGHGKDSCANFIKSLLYEKFGDQINCQYLSFATKLKELVREMFDLSFDQVYDVEQKETPLSRFGGATPRQILQRFGTEFGRSIWNDIWVTHYADALEDLRKVYPEGLFNTFVFTTDLRFRNEFEYLKSKKDFPVFLIRVVRPGFSIVENAHASETDLDGITDWDYTIVANNLDELLDKTEPMVIDILRKNHTEEN